MYRTFEFCSGPFLELEVVQPIQSKPRCLAQTCHETLKHRFDHRTLSPPPLCIYLSLQPFNGQFPFFFLLEASTVLQRIASIFFFYQTIHGNHQFSSLSLQLIVSRLLDSFQYLNVLRQFPSLSSLEPFNGQFPSLSSLEPSNGYT